MRGDHGEVATVLIQNGGKVIGKDGELVDLADSPLAGNVRLFTGYDPEWEIDPSSLILQEKIGGSHALMGHACRTATLMKLTVTFINSYFIHLRFMDHLCCSTWSRYLLLGEGEFGVVHKARWHGTIVAVKILKDTGAVAIGDFKTELNVLLKVHHTHTVSKPTQPYGQICILPSMMTVYNCCLHCIANTPQTVSLPRCNSSAL